MDRILRRGKWVMTKEAGFYPGGQCCLNQGVLTWGEEG